MCGENKGADQLHSYCAGDLCFCFRICKIRFSPDEVHIFQTMLMKNNWENDMSADNCP